MYGPNFSWSDCEPSALSNALVGKTINRVNIPNDRQSITFTTDDGETIELHVDADCCSYTWIESLDDEQAIIGTVTEVEQIEMPNLGDIDTNIHKTLNQYGVEHVEYYGLKITTNKGRCVIDYRNDSNGYYGGALCLVRGTDDPS